MADQDLPESSPAGSGRGKQIVFLFMSAVVVAVVIFLFGVSVGKGVKKGPDAASATDGASAGTETTAATPPPAQPAQTDLNYHDALRSGAPPDPSRADKTGASASAAAPTTSGPPPAVDEAPPTKEPAKAPTPAASTHKGAQYFLQVGAYGTASAAQRVVTKVKAADSKYAVSTVTLPSSAPPPRFKVMVGPYSSVDEAKAAMSRLKKQGFETILKR